MSLLISNFNMPHLLFFGYCGRSFGSATTIRVSNQTQLKGKISINNFVDFIIGLLKFALNYDKSNKL